MNFEEIKKACILSKDKVEDIVERKGPRKHDIKTYTFCKTMQLIADVIDAYSNDPADLSDPMEFSDRIVEAFFDEVV